MRFIIKKGTPLFKELSKLKKEMDACVTAAGELVEEVNVGDHYRPISNPNILVGGVLSFEIRKGTQAPPMWKKVSGRESFPLNRKENKELLDKLKALPTIERRRFNDLIGFDWREHCEERHIIFGPGYRFAKDYILIGFSDSVSPKLYKPVEGMTEITVSEWQKLWDKK